MRTDPAIEAHGERTESVAAWAAKVLPFAEQGGLSTKVDSPTFVSLHVVVLSLLKLMMSYLVELHTGRLLKH